MFCEFCNGRCELCGHVLPQHVVGQVRRRCEAAKPRRDAINHPCKYFEGFTGGSVEAQRGCGCKTATAETMTGWCELFEFCTVTQPAAEESIPCCESRCNDYQRDE